MRPIKLEMTAFGPYSGKECIDFEQLEHQHLFLVTGPTGAGKTTVFDAICFALYGESSGTDRPVKSLRCDNASADLLTEVILTFELKGKVHTIHRIPSQLKKKVRGEGFTEQKPEATLTLSGKEYPVTGKDNVTEAVKSLIGLEVDQFRQIMMIPQGEFRKLLMAKSDERTEILKRIFQTTFYGLLQNRFREEKKQLETELESAMNQRLKELQRIELDGLVDDDEVGESQERLKELLGAEHLHIAEIIMAAKAYVASEEIKKESIKIEQETLKAKHKEVIEKKTTAIFNNEKLLEFESNKMALQELTLKEEQIKNDRVLLEKISHARNILPYEQSLLKRGDEKKRLENEIDQLKVSMVKSEALLDEVKANLDETTAEAYTSELEMLQRKGIQLAGHAEQLQKVIPAQKKVADLKKAIQDKESKLKALVEETEQAAAAYVENEKQVASIKDLAVKKEQLEHDYQKRATWMQALEKLRDLEKDILDKLENKGVVQTKMQAQEGQVAQMKESYLKTKKLWYMNQAALIAQELKEGEPCPVCGSENHVHLATFTSDHVSEEVLQEVENTYGKSQEHLYKIESQLKALDAMIDQLKHQAEDSKSSLLTAGIIESEEGILSAIVKNQGLMDEQKAHLSALDRELEMAKASQEKQKDLEDKKDKLEIARKATEDAVSQLQLSLREEASVAKTLVSAVPETLRDPALLKEQLDQMRERYKLMLQKKETAEKRYKAGREHTLQLQSKYEQLQEAVQTSVKTYENERSDFLTKLESAGFDSEDTYRHYREQVEKFESLQEKITSYDKTYHTLKETVSKGEEKVSGLVMVDMSQFDLTLNTLEFEQQAIQQTMSDMERRIKNNLNHVALSEKISKEIESSEEKYKVMGHLSDVVNGQNKKKLTFERFILATYLSDVIEVANQRLHKMTNNRYTLKISTAVMDKRSSGGLDLEVFDSYTGVDRSVKTLSGGESFKASLAMALALAEVVQAYAGGIQLDTVFIDEGFGTLDQESLDSAINCLIELQDSGRLVGIISHVQELKERIRTQLIVEMDDAGSYTRFQVQ